MKRREHQYAKEIRRLHHDRGRDIGTIAVMLNIRTSIVRSVLDAEPAEGNAGEASLAVPNDRTASEPSRG